ncbi:toxin-activating lysine-acyltransferase [Shinella sp. CPCC 101442]|uniref:toxin-activating lysine-acyltransferase n=1 Tax=Shinella sp. CPCC 101442 TaxID=2932265 RepID=UPI002152D333|nr:toxin-activating lysine-acyltransferase [Shinella sp. CPCC 101442]MCR6501356.1 toxin-activating lysine-acyltransferase [Shinella sp. CPCC 101442]
MIPSQENAAVDWPEEIFDIPGSHAADFADLPAVERTRDMLRVGRARNAGMALGLAVNHLAGKPAYDQLKFNTWSKVLIGQINRGHYRFVLSADGSVAGMLGWTFADRRTAEAWLQGKSQARSGTQKGDCIIINVWSADTPRAHSLLLNAARQVARGCEALYFRRVYNDGRMRPARLTINQFVDRHAQRAMAL